MALLFTHWTTARKYPTRLIDSGTKAISAGWAT